MIKNLQDLINMELFKQLSPLAGTLGVFSCICSVGAFALPFPSSIIVFIISLLFGISLAKMGFAEIIDQDEFYRLINKIDERLDSDKN